ncbi:RTA1 like protein-domain-containing protein [Penicillium lagena]|uniref:RTA1 like protein-domain-containing protein n=1 Tax=Penicillium lagena TaxID=94218 RepID=UPI0025424C70|nr:RTA1 like protein-domain-containing protein [Penicillium lagena]KAJ5612221.1 RTA1 like protein-domain-containing protein [Penicillium lagena]
MKSLTLFILFVLLLGEVIGYATRAAATPNTGSLILYLFQSIFLVIPPLGFAATLYMVYSRIVRAIHGENLSPVPMRWATKIFVGGDFTCFMIQGNAAGLLGSDNTTIVQIADYIIIVGLVLQILLFLLFIVCCIIFHRRMNVYVKDTRIYIQSSWKSDLNMLYGTSTAVLVRNIYRVVEYVMQSISQHRYLLTHEWPLYVFDSQLMLFLMIGFYVCNPTKLRHCTTESEMELQSSESPASAKSSNAASPSN